MQGAFAGPHALALFFTTNTPYLCRSKQLAHCTPMYYTKGKKFFLASYIFWFFHPDYQQITQCKMISKHLTLSYTTSYTILHNSLHYLTPHITLSYTASYTHICHSINTSSGRRPRSNGHTKCGHRGSGKYDAPTDFSASRWCAAALAQRIFPSAWHLMCKRCVR